MWNLPDWMTQPRESLWTGLACQVTSYFGTCLRSTCAIVWLQLQGEKPTKLDDLAEGSWAAPSLVLSWEAWRPANFSKLSACDAVNGWLMLFSLIRPGEKTCKCALQPHNSTPHKSCTVWQNRQGCGKSYFGTMMSQSPRSERCARQRHHQALNH